MTNNDMAGYFVAGIGVSLAFLVIFQFGLNIGIRISVRMLEEYPAAAKFLIRNRGLANVYPYIIKNKDVSA